MPAALPIVAGVVITAAAIYAGYRIYEEFDDFREWQRLHGRRRRREQPYGSYSPSWYQPGVNEKPRESASAETTGRNMQEKQAFDDLRKRAPAREVGLDPFEGSIGAQGDVPLTPQARCSEANLRVATAGLAESSLQSSSADTLRLDPHNDSRDPSVQTGVTPFPPPAPAVPSASSSPAVSRMPSPTPTLDVSEDGFSHIGSSEGYQQEEDSMGVRSASDESEPGMSWLDPASDSDSASEAEPVPYTGRGAAAANYV